MTAPVSLHRSSFPQKAGLFEDPLLQINSSTGLSPTTKSIEEAPKGTSPIDGARDGTRTHDLLITNQLRYQLRHSSIFGCCGSAVFGGAAPCTEIYRSPRRIRFVYRKLPLPPGAPRHTSESKAPCTRYRRTGIIPTSQRSSIKPLS